MSWLDQALRSASNRKNYRRLPTQNLRYRESSPAHILTYNPIPSSPIQDSSFAAIVDSNQQSILSS